jgi:hypothetical protein
MHPQQRPESPHPGEGASIEVEERPHEKRRGRLKNGNPPGDFFYRNGTKPPLDLKSKNSYADQVRVSNRSIVDKLVSRKDKRLS